VARHHTKLCVVGRKLPEILLFPARVPPEPVLPLTPIECGASRLVDARPAGYAAGVPASTGESAPRTRTTARFYPASALRHGHGRSRS